MQSNFALFGVPYITKKRTSAHRQKWEDEDFCSPWNKSKCAENKISLKIREMSRMMLKPASENKVPDANWAPDLKDPTTWSGNVVIQHIDD